LDAQKQTVLLAEAQMRGARLTKPLKLADAIERFAFVHLGDAAPLVIDGSALQRLGLSGETMVPLPDLSPQAGRPFWEKLGLIYVPCARGALLTSTRRMQQLGIDRPAQTGDLDGAIE